jgi:GWxTD domain-containing protein
LCLIAVDLALSVVAQPQQAACGDPGNSAGQKGRKTRGQRARSEMNDTRADWLNQDALYIITPAEREAFQRLGTNEERDQFIERFWQLRNPRPESPENSFKEEHYRRMAYANEHFSSGVLGWKTDRGHIYILWGPPDEIESHPSGGRYDRPLYEGGGSTETYPWERWRYRHLEDIGDNIELEFVDPSGSGEFHLTRDPGEKDALLHVPGVGRSVSEMLNGGSKAGRFTNPNGTTLPAPIGALPASMDEFATLDLYFRIMRPPEHLKDLTALVSSRIVGNSIRLDYAVDFLRVTNDSVLMPITLQIANREMAYRNDRGVESATLNLYVRITTPGGQLVSTFEEVIARDIPATLFEKTLEQSSIFQKAVPIRPGLYRLAVVVKDTQSGNVGIIDTALRVPRFDSESVGASSLILADKIESVPSSDLGLGPFVFGSYRVRPRLSHEFAASENLGFFLQLYNLRTDEALGKSSIFVTYALRREDEEVWESSESSGSIRQTGEQVTLNRLIPLAAFPPGRYTLMVTARDRVSGQSVSRRADFQLKP